MSITKIAEVVVGSGGAASIDFTSIPGTYTDLMVVVSGRQSTSSHILAITVNGSTSGYSWRRLIGDGSSAFSDNSTSYANLRFIGATGSGDTSNTFGNSIFYIPNYAGSTNKSVSFDGASENNATASDLNLSAGLWSNTAAITQVSIIPNSGTWVQYSSATLYGILKGSSGGVTVS